jgi:hypothetical protein
MGKSFTSFNGYGFWSRDPCLERPAMKQTKFPRGWDAARVRRVLALYESQTDAEAVAEDEAAYETGRTMMSVPTDLVATVRELIARRASGPRPRRGRKTGSAAHVRREAKRSRPSDSARVTARLDEVVAAVGEASDAPTSARRRSRRARA